MSGTGWRAGCALALAVVLSACGGGGGGSSEPPIQATAVDDTAMVAWNTASPIDVLGNDSASRGAVTLSATGQPSHGTATIESGRLSYTPDAGYFGTDSLTYTVAAEDGTTASATVRLSVRASLTLDGALAGGPWDGATVRAAVGAQHVDAAVDTNTTTSGGTFSVVIETADPAEVISLVASGSDATGGKALRSLLGDAGSVAQAAGADGHVGAAQYPSVNLSALSTALAAMFDESAAPATQTALAAYTLSASISRLDELATAIKLVNDLGVALPAGVVDSVALIDQPSTSTVLADFLATQVASGGRYVDALTEDRLRPTGAQPVAVGGPQSLAYFIGHQKASFLFLQVTYAPDGTAEVLTDDGARAATWTIADGALTLVLATPFDFDATALDPSSNDYVAATGHISGYSLAQLTGTQAGGVVTYVQLGSWTLLEGPNTGLEVPFGSTMLPSTAVVADLGQLTAPALNAAEFNEGAQWGGLIVGDTGTGVPQEDTLVIGAAGSAAFTRTGLASTWSVTDGIFVVSTGGQERAYQRLLAAAPSGEEQWLVTTRSAGQPVAATVQMVARLQPGLAFAADGSAARRWQSGVDEGTFYELAADGTGSLLNQSNIPASAPQSLTWVIAADGSLSIAPVAASSVRAREWLLVGRQGGAILVNEHLISGDLWRLNVYTDAGPAAATAAAGRVRAAARPSAAGSIRAPRSPTAAALRRAGRAAA